MLFLEKQRDSSRLWEMSPSSQTTDLSSYHAIRLEAGHFNLIGDWDGSTLVPVYERAGLFLVCPKVSAVMVRGEPCGASPQFLTGFSRWWNLSSNFCSIHLWGGQKLLLAPLHFSPCLSISQCLRRAVEPNVRFWLRFLLLSIPNPETQLQPLGRLQGLWFAFLNRALQFYGMGWLFRHGLSWSITNQNLSRVSFPRPHPPFPGWFFTVTAQEVYS